MMRKLTLIAVGTLSMSYIYVIPVGKPHPERNALQHAEAFVRRTKVKKHACGWALLFVPVSKGKLASLTFEESYSGSLDFARTMEKTNVRKVGQIMIHSRFSLIAISAFSYQVGPCGYLTSLVLSAQQQLSSRASHNCCSPRPERLRAVACCPMIAETAQRHCDKAKRFP